MAQVMTAQTQSDQAARGLSVVLPAYNEAATIRAVVERLLAELPEAEVIVVDDGSRDGTAMALTGLPIVIIRHPYNKGNGAAVKTGLRAAHGEWVLMLDADGQHNAADVMRILTYTDEYDMIIGARPSQSQASLGRAIGNRLLNALASYVAGRPVEDLTSGFRAMRRARIMEFVHLLPNGYSYPTTSTLCFFKAGYNVKYVPLSAERRRAGHSGIKLTRDGSKFIMIIFRMMTLFSPMRLFLPLTLLLLSGGVASAIYESIIFTRLRLPNSTVLFILASLLIFLMGLISEQIAALRFERRDQ